MTSRVNHSNVTTRKGPAFALLAAALFGFSTPLAKLLLGNIQTILLAALLYLGSGIGLGSWLLVRRFIRTHEEREARLTRIDLPWLASAIIFGGIIAPILLLGGLRWTPAASASLLLNLEGVFTATLAWFVFRENFDTRIALGMLAIIAGGLLLSWVGRPEVGVPWGPIAIVGACLGWAIDNNLTRKVSSGDPIQIAAAKGLFAGTVNLVIALAIGVRIPSTASAFAAALLGFLSYGVSLSLFVLALRYIGTARTGAYFSTAPFVGALLSLIILKDSPTVAFVAAAG